ncbi:helix-turn-helix domain-containing protein [Paenibacillaceae bacterium]|nr:helix-turn-helix domain-containing protein [Paenibacillaceae bacterium]
MYYSMSRLSVKDVKWTDLFNVKLNPSFFNKHDNPYYELIVVAEGAVNLEVDGARTILQAGDSLLLRPWELHNGWNPNERQGKFFWAQFSCTPEMEIIDARRLAELDVVHTERTELRTVEFGHEDLLILPRLHNNKQPYKLLSRFEELVDTMKQPKGYFRYQSTLLISEMLGFIANDFLEQSHLDTNFPVSYFTFRKLVNHLNNFYETELTSGEKLEQAMDYKYEYLCQVFKKYTGIPMSRYTQQLRVQRAKHFLRNSSMSIQEIAQEVGYPDQFYFSRLFKKLEGVAPQHYRDFKQNSSKM